MLERIALTCSRHRRVVVIGWIALVVALSALASVAGGTPRSNFSLPGSESQAATDLLAEGGFGGRGGIVGHLVVVTPDTTDSSDSTDTTDASAAVAALDSPAVAEPLAELAHRVERDVEGVRVAGVFDEPGTVSPDGRVGLVPIEFGDIAVSDAVELADDVRSTVERFDGLPEGVAIEFGGDVFWEEVEFSSEAIGLIAAVVILLLAFGSVIAMGLPIGTALVGIGCGMALVAFAARLIDVPEFAPAAVAMIGIGVGIDYALMIVTRFREELAGGRDVEGAIARSLGTAGRAVFFAGLTVIVSMVGLLVVGVPATQSLAVAVIAGVAMVLIASLTLLPALLSIVGTRIDRLRVRRRPAGAADLGSFWYRWSRGVQRRPALVALAGLVVLATLAAPTLSMRLGFGDAGNRPDTDTARRAHDLVAEGFGPGANAPLLVAIDRSGDPEVTDRFVDAAARTEGVAEIGGVLTGPDSVDLVRVIPTTGPQDEATTDLVVRLRDEVVPSVLAEPGNAEPGNADVTDLSVATIVIGGATAAVVDFADDQASRLPLFIAAVLSVAFVLLMLVYRSILVPLKAVVMNLLSIGAAYGVVVAVFQWGWGLSALGVGEPGPIEAWVPMMLFAIVFGLSMDYEVFLLSRIREHYLRSGDNAAAVADGLARTGRLITAAAAIMVCVFGAFVLSDDRSLQLFGFGLAVAVLIDATIVRLLLVPATMELLGDRNWWFPGRRTGAPS